MITGDKIEEIRNLSKRNIYHHFLNSIERKQNEGVITEEQALDAATRLVCDYCNNKKDVIAGVLQTERIFIIDAIMGSGKTTYILDKLIPDNAHERFICVLPTLEECQRYREALKTKVPVKIYEPIAKGGSKLNDFQTLIGENVNIVTTHELIRRIDEKTINLLEKTEYNLIIDECLNVVEDFNKKFKSRQFKNIDLNDLERLEYVYIDNHGFLEWNDTNAENYDGRYEDVKNLCKLRSLMKLKVKDTYSNSILIWNFPVKFFDLFKKCYICTYLWDGSLQKAYFDLHGIDYIHMTLRKGNLDIYNATKDLLLREDVYSLINLYDGKLNDIGIADRYNEQPLSASWYKNKARKDKAYLGIIKNNAVNYFKNIVRTPSKENMFTVFKKHRGIISGAGYARGFVSCNAKATNDYREKRSLAYLINRFLEPNINNFFNSYGVEINQKLYAVSELLQWIWRSRIRDGEPINLYLPSKRMRELLQSWVDGKI